MKKRIKVISLSLIGIFILSNIIWFMMSRWIMPNDKIESDMLKLMPIGSSVDEVVSVIKSTEKWYIPTSSGLMLGSKYFITYYPTEDYDKINRILLYIESNDWRHPLYRELYPVSVTLMFDEESKLREVEVRKFLRI